MIPPELCGAGTSALRSFIAVDSMVNSIGRVKEGKAKESLSGIIGMRHHTSASFRFST
jgi:hypothetical protein